MENRRIEILNAFSSIVARHSINRTTMRDVAKETGYSIGTIYNEFANKEALIDGLFEQKKIEFEKLLLHLSGICHAEGEMRLRRFILGYIKEYNQKMRQDYVFVELVRDARYFRFIGLKAVDFNQFIRRKALAILEGILHAGVQAGSFYITDIAFTAILILNAFTMYLLPSPAAERHSDSIAKEAEAMLELLIKALRTR